MSPADVARSPAVRLFVERVRDVQPDFRLTPANASTVAMICRRLDALPLALELAAPWIKVLTVEDLLRRLGDDVLFSTIAGPRDLPERQQTINATVAWSYRLLRPDEQRVFRHLGALPGLFPLDAAVAVLAGREMSPGSDDALGSLAVLMDKSLLLRAPTSLGHDASVVPRCSRPCGLRGPSWPPAGQRRALEGWCAYRRRKPPWPRKADRPNQLECSIAYAKISRATAAR